MHISNERVGFFCMSEQWHLFMLSNFTQMPNASCCHRGIPGLLFSSDVSPSFTGPSPADGGHCPVSRFPRSPVPPADSQSTSDQQKRGCIRAPPRWESLSADLLNFITALVNAAKMPSEDAEVLRIVSGWVSRRPPGDRSHLVTQSPVWVQ